jgi:hypothetical protein
MVSPNALKPGMILNDARFKAITAVDECPSLLDVAPCALVKLPTETLRFFEMSTRPHIAELLNLDTNSISTFSSYSTITLQPLNAV